MNNQQFSSTHPQPSIPSLPGTGELLGKALHIYKSRIGVFLGIAVIPVLISLFYAFLFFVAKSFPFFLILIGGSSVVGIVVSLWAQVALLYAIKERDQEIGIKEALNRGWSKTLSYFWISLLSGFIIAGAFLLFIIPGIILSICFSLAAYVLISEDTKGMTALLRSKQLVKGYWWKIFWRFLALGFILCLITLPIVIIAEIFNISFITNIVSILIAPLSITFGFLIYENLKQIKSEALFEPPKKKTRVRFIILGVIGALLIPIIIVVAVVLIILGGGLGQKLLKDAKVMAYMHDVKTAAEFIHTSEESYSKVSCEHFRLNPVCDNIDEQLGEKPTIYSSQDAFCSYVKLLSGDYYFCLDSIGNVEKTDINPEGEGYCDGTTFVCPQENKN